MNYVVILHEGKYSDYEFRILYVGSDQNQAELVKTTIEEKIKKVPYFYNDPYKIEIETYSDDDNRMLFINECRLWDAQIENQVDNL